VIRLMRRWKLAWNVVVITPERQLERIAGGEAAEASPAG